MNNVSTCAKSKTYRNKFDEAAPHDLQPVWRTIAQTLLLYAPRVLQFLGDCV